MRLISGSAGGIPLEVPKNVTRPTQDRVKQAIFNMLGELVDGARVLDVFAGSGALGLECLSRGAASALLIEQDRAACEVIRKNITKTRLENAAVRQGDVFKVLPQLAEQGGIYDLVFADPPYANKPGEEDLSLKLALLPDLHLLMAPGGSFILECRASRNSPAEWGPWEMVRDREYGSTRILWLRKR
ncbi:16S rRNA (guanine966-N2)-methyltransferase [Prosthecobacter fusiformis]|uniref:16S rRNA (Guanine966-N2)-methyltransferase n=1 Tax=Prosthecobacter fusiformis TaxID=48464 RepID=A0A4R7RLW1_9BACT|nr:16S rRNA (guanine(966)-N(2))-methyltransferase RsmD [Prosthecobacter fusiformis]TDU64572.1 16S rRNA (guanine966-N2)-methyltransferase [Prosthecobacter fusiformis]